MSTLDRRREVPHEGPMCDILWSDPDETLKEWQVSPRGAGFLFGSEVNLEFQHTNGLNLLCRAHQLVLEGHRQMFNDRLVTVWSAPNYCYRCGNVASILKLDKGSRMFLNFSAAPQERRDQFPPHAGPAPDYFI